MSAHVTREQLDRLRQGTLSPAQAAEVGRHAAACRTCGPVVAAAVSLDRGVRELRVDLDGEHLSPDTLMAIADGTGDSAEHLQQCESCRAEVEELRELAPRPRLLRHWPVYAAAAAIAAMVMIVPLLDRRPVSPEPPPRVATAVEPPAVPQTAGYSRPEWEEEVAAVRARRSLAVPAVIEELRPRTSSLRGGAEDEDLQLRPNGYVVAGTRPRFEWMGSRNARYRVILQRGDRIVESETLTAPAWTPPFELQRGAEYAWQVEVTIGGTRSVHPRQPDPPARFRVVAQKVLDEIDDARRRHPDDPLLLVVILARHGLRDETLQEIARLEQRDAALAAALRHSVVTSLSR